MTCVKCGTQNLASSQSCVYCGERLHAAVITSTHGVNAGPAAKLAPDRPEPVSSQPSTVPILQPLQQHTPPYSKLPRAGRLFAFFWMVIFPLSTFLISLSDYKEITSVSPDLIDGLEKAFDTAFNKPSHDAGTEIRQIQKLAADDLFYDCLLSVYAAWIGYSLFTRRPKALRRAKRFMIVLALYAVVREFVLPGMLDIQVVTGGRTLILLLLIAGSSYLYLARSKAASEAWQNT